MNLKLTAVAAFTALCFNAQATTTDWGAHDPLEVAASITATGAFEDLYLFTIGQPGLIFSTAVANNLTQMLGISDGVVRLYQEEGAVDDEIASFTFGGFSGNSSNFLGPLGMGDYYYSVSGQGTGSVGGFYTLSSQVTPVPEPSMPSLLLAGLAMMGFIVRRRAQHEKTR